MSSPSSEPTRLVPVPQPVPFPLAPQQSVQQSVQPSAQQLGHPSAPPLVPPRPVAGRALDQRIGDAERSGVCDELSMHYAAGRLTDEELDARVDAAMSARTQAELRRVVADLPSGAPAAAPSAPASPAGTSWSAVDVLALLTLIGTLGVAALGALMVILGGTLSYAVIATLSAVTAGLGGMALTQLLHRGHRSVVDRAVLRVREDQRRLSGRA